MAEYGTDFDEFSTGATSTNLTGFTDQSVASTTSEIVDLGAGDHVMRHTKSANGLALITYDAFATTGEVECLAKITLATTSDQNAQIGPALIASDNTCYAIRANTAAPATTWRLAFFNASGAVSGSIGTAATFSEPTAGTPFWLLIGRDAAGDIYASMWLDGAGRPGSPMTSGTPGTVLTTVKPGMTTWDASDDPMDFQWFGAATAGDTAPESAGGGGTVNTETLESTIAVTDEPLDYVFYNRALDSSIELTDEIVATVVGTISRILTDTLTVDDGAVLFYRRNRLLDDTIVVTEGTTEQFTTTNILVDDTIDVVDSVIRYLQFNRQGESAVVITDSLIAALINYVIQTAVLSSAIEVTDDEAHFVYVTRLVESTLGLFDESQSSLLRFILLTDALSVDDSATATYVPDPGTPGQVFNPVIRIGFDQPRIDIGGHAVI